MLIWIEVILVLPVTLLLLVILMTRLMTGSHLKRMYPAAQSASLHSVASLSELLRAVIMISV